MLAREEVREELERSAQAAVADALGELEAHTSERRRVIEEMAEGGMVGLEVFHPDHDDEMRTKYAAIAERLGLIPTSSSDCHGERYGYRMGEERTDPETFAELKRRAGR